MGGGPDAEPEHLLAVLPFPEPTAIFDRIRKKHPHIKCSYYSLAFVDTPWKSLKSVPREIYKDVTILVTISALPPSPEDCPKLDLIHFLSAGTNHIAHSPIYTSTDITLTTSSGIHGPQIAEWVVMTALVQSHRYHTLYEWQKEHHWAKGGEALEFMKTTDQVGQRLGVLGYGSIGRQVARVGKAMGMDVIAYTARPRTTKESRKDGGFIVPGTGDPDGDIPSAWFSGLEKEQLHAFLKQDIDHLLVSVPLTEDTTHFLGKDEFEILGRSRNAFVTNISRGQILRQADLIEALRKGPENGGLRGAALDVADPEPLPPDNPLWSAPNVIVTPHISSHGSSYVDRSFQVLEVNLTRKEKGQKLINVVDRKRGY